MVKTRILQIVGLLAAITSAAHLLNEYAGVDLGAGTLAVLRWLTLAAAAAYAVRKQSLTTWIVFSMLIGTEIGYDLPSKDYPELYLYLKTVSKIFIKMIKTIIAPLLFATLVVGIASHADMKQVGRMGLKSLVYFEIVTTVALFIGLAAINISQAGVGISLPPDAAHETLAEAPKQSIQDIILHIFPENFAKSVAEGQVLQIVVFSVIFAIALSQVVEKHKAPMLAFAESLSETMFKFTNLVMYLAPFGVGAAIAGTVGHMGISVLSNLFMLLATLYVALIVFLLAVLLPVALIVKVPIRRFVKAISEPVSIAFSTTSSEAALPKAMKAMESLGVPRKIVAFVMPTGYSFNLDGTTLYLSLAAVFVSQAAGKPMDFGTQLLMVFTLMITSKGVAGVPRASLVILMGTVASFNLPQAPIYLILAIDELMDMARTSVNVIGNCLASVVIARWEGEYDPNYVHEYEEGE